MPCPSGFVVFEIRESRLARLCPQLFHGSRGFHRLLGCPALSGFAFASLPRTRLALARGGPSSKLGPELSNLIINAFSLLFEAC